MGLKKEEDLNHEIHEIHERPKVESHVMCRTVPFHPQIWHAGLGAVHLLRPSLSEELAAVLATGVLVWSNRSKLLDEWGDVVATAPFYK